MPPKYLINRLIPLVFLLLFGFFIRTLYCTNNSLLDRDSILYCEIAENWHRTNKLDVSLLQAIGNTDAGYIYILKKGIDFHLPVVLWGRMIGVLSTFTYLITVYLIGLTIFKDHRALLLLLLACIQPATGQMSFTLLRDPICYSFYAISILALLHLFPQKSYVWTALFCVSAVLAFLMRYESIELFVIFFVLSFFNIKQHKDKKFLFWSLFECVIVSSLLFLSILELTEIPMEKSFTDISTKFTLLISK